MRKSDVMCPACHAGFQRIELTSVKGPSGNFHCPVCNRAIETLDGSKLIAYRLTVAPITEACGIAWNQSGALGAFHRREPRCMKYPSAIINLSAFTRRP